jgi:hypothetical protein
MSKYEDKYLGSKRIKIVQDAGKTEGNADLLKITFDDNSSEIWSVLALEAEGVVTPQVSDDSTLMAHKLYPVVNKVLEIARDFNLKLSEFNYLDQLVIASVTENADRANRFLWKVPYLDHRTMNDLHLVMQQIQPTLKDVIPGDNS